MIRRLALPAMMLAQALAAAAAAAPELAFHVTDENVDVFVALFDGQAVELAGCGNSTEARALLELPASADAVGSTLAVLQSEFGYGTHPRIPCAAASFDIDWPATTPIWADVQGSGLYYLPAPGGGSGFYALPSRCTALRAALAIRERLQLPGVLQGLMAPPDPGDPLILDCGDSVAAEPGAGGAPAAAQWSLHRFDTFLSELSTGDTIYVARYARPGEDAMPAYLPIWRLDGRDISALILEGGEDAEGAEAALRALLNIPPAAAVSPLGAEAVSTIRSAVFADICTEACDGYVHRHAAFANPALDLGLSELAAGVRQSRTDRLGAGQLVWSFLDGRTAVFTGCDRLTASMGLTAAAAADWAASVEAGLAAAAERGGFDCRAGGPDTCTRRLAEDRPLQTADLAAGADCPGARHLRLELPARVRTTGPLALTDPAFDSVTLLPAPGVERVLLIGTPGLVGSGSNRCILSSAESLIVTSGLPRLSLQRIDLARVAGTGTGEVVALQAQAGAIALDNVVVGREGEGLAPVGRGVDLCLADLYAADSRIEATSLTLQGTAARLLITGSPAAPAVIARARVGMLLSADSRARLHRLDIRAANPIVLRGAAVTATATSLEPAGDGPAAGSAALLERASSLEMTTSTARGFRCAVSFADPASRASFVLPGNDLARDNTHLACGGGQFSLIE